MMRKQTSVSASVGEFPDAEPAEGLPCTRLFAPFSKAENPRVTRGGAT